MKTDEDVVRDLLVRVAPDFEPLDAGTVRTEAETLPERNRTAVWALATAVLVIVIAVAVVATRRTPDRHATATQPGTSTSATVKVTPGPKPAPFRLELKLPGTRFPADGTPIHAELLAINNTGSPIGLRHAGCGSLVHVGLSGGYVHFDGGMRLANICAVPPFRPGVTHIPVTIATTYQGCQQGRLPGTRQLPHCMGAADSTLPPIPPGRYLVDIVPQGLSVTPMMPPPIWITLLPN